jgi:hypothetical protein
MRRFCRHNGDWRLRVLRRMVEPTCQPYQGPASLVDKAATAKFGAIKFVDDGNARVGVTESGRFPTGVMPVARRASLSSPQRSLSLHAKLRSASNVNASQAISNRTPIGDSNSAAWQFVNASRSSREDRDSGSLQIEARGRWETDQNRAPPNATHVT